MNSVNATDMNITEDERTSEFSNSINGASYNISVAAVNRAGTGPTSTIIVTTLTDDEGNYVCIYVYVHMYVSMYCSYKCNEHVHST